MSIWSNINWKEPLESQYSHDDEHGYWFGFGSDGVYQYDSLWMPLYGFKLKSWKH